MKKMIKTIHRINAAPEKVWSSIRKGDGVDNWLPMITTCRLEGRGVGAKRICTTEQGALKETILLIDEKHKTFQYGIEEQPLLPIDNIVATMSVLPDGEGTILNWDMAFTLSDESLFTMVEQVVEGMYAAGAEGLENISK